MTLIKKIEALLYAAGKGMTEEDLARLSGHFVGEVQASLKQLQADYVSRDCSLMIARDGPLWKMTVRPDYMALISKLVERTELDRGTMETLAYVAYSAPVMQSEIIKQRSSAAYDHLKSLEEIGFIKREEKGRSKLVRLTEKFYDYFDINENEKEKFFEVLKMQEIAIAKVREDLLARDVAMTDQLRDTKDREDPFATPVSVDSIESEVSTVSETDSPVTNPDTEQSKDNTDISNGP